MIGMTLLAASSFMALLIVILPSFRRIHSGVGVRIVETLTALSAFLIASSLFYLIYAFLTSDLSFLNVALNSHSASDVLYKISGVWGNHEGSMLLWLTLLTGVSTIFAIQKNAPQEIRLQVLRILGAISFCFHLFILLVSNPFVQLQQTPMQGMGLNPLLEDPTLAIHPPVLYTGLALLSTLYAMSCTGLKLNKLDQNWALLMRPWVFACWSFLTLGIVLGSWWAYYELGWGGWWFWDPVENLSLLPWLTVTALLHSLIAVDKNASQQLSASMLGILAFLLALFSLFLVRSGMLSSVHAFAVDPFRGSFLGAILVIFSLYGVKNLIRFRNTRPRNLPHFLSKEAFLFFNAMLLIAITSVVLMGTVYPLLLDSFTGRVISVGAPYFNAATMPFFLLMIMLMVVIPFIGWKQQQVRKSISYVLTFGMAAFIFLSYWKQGWPVIASLFLAASLCLLLSVIIDVIKKRSHITLRFLGMSLAHASIAVCVMAAVVDSFDKVETLTAMKEADNFRFEGFDVTLSQVQQLRAPYFQREVASFAVTTGKDAFNLKPEKRFYPLHEMITSETAIHSVGLGDLYAVLGGMDQQNMWIIKLTWHPAIRLLWIGAGLMVLAGLLGFIAVVRRRKVVRFLIPILLICGSDASADEFKELTTSIYCPTCQGQVLDESSSQVAVQMKHDIHHMLQSGKTPDAIRARYVQLYGEKVLLKPQLQPHTYALWITPFIIFLLALMVVVRRIRFFRHQIDVK